MLYLGPLFAHRKDAMSAVVTINREDDVTLDFEWLDVDGTPQNLTGATVAIVENPLCPDLVATITDPTMGIGTVTQPHTSTRKMPHTSYFRLVVTPVGGPTKSTPRIELHVS